MCKRFFNLYGDSLESLDAYVGSLRRFRFLHRIARKEKIVEMFMSSTITVYFIDVVPLTYQRRTKIAVLFQTMTLRI